VRSITALPFADKHFIMHDLALDLRTSSGRAESLLLSRTGLTDLDHAPAAELKRNPVPFQRREDIVTGPQRFISVPAIRARSGCGT
jgi:hypothetical protein